MIGIGGVVTVLTLFISGLPVEFDSNHSLTDYGVDKMIDYKKHVAGFFKFFAEFNYNNVMSPFTGTAHNVCVYKSRHPKFLLKGIFIAGPIKVGKNCGIADYGHKEKFVAFCKASSDFLIQNKF